MALPLFPATCYDWDTEARAPRPRQAPAILTEKVVTVGRTNGHGFQTTARDWLNWSNFARPEDVRMPDVGQTVTVYLDKAGYVRRIDAAGQDSPASPAPARMASAPANVAPTPATVVAPAATSVPTPAPAEPPSLAAHIAQDDRGTIITRLAVLNTATAILASGGGAATVDEVLTVAAQLEAWATREGDIRKA